MKKFFTFLMLLSTLCLSAIAAEVEVNRLYHVTCKRGAWTYDGGQMKGATADAADVKQQFAFVLYDSNTYLWSQAAQHFIDTDGVAKSVLEASPIQWEDLGDGTFRFYFSDDKNINLTQGMVLIDDWNEADDGNIMTLTPVEGFSSSTVLSVLKADISKKTFTFHIIGAPEGSNAKATYNGTQYAGEETVEAVSITPAELTATDIAGYAYSITVDGTDINVAYTELPFIQGQTYTLTLRGKSLVYDPSTGLLKTDVAATGNDAYFKLNGNSADGFTFFSVAANKYFQVQDETVDNAKAYAVAETEADATRYDYVGYEGGFTFKIHGTTDNYINERDNAFSTWNSGWGKTDGGGKLTFTVVEVEPEGVAEGDFYVKNPSSGTYFGFVGTSTSNGNFGPVAADNKLVCSFTQPEEGTFNIKLQGFNYVSCGTNGGFSNNTAANPLQLFKVNGSSAVKATTIEEGAEYLIVGNKNGTDYALSNGTNGKTGADLRTAGIAVTITDNTISTVFNACKWTFETYVNTDTREALEGVYIKNGEGKYFAIGGEGDDVNLLDEGQLWNIAPVTGHANAYTLENAELDAVKRFINSGSYGYTSKGEDYNARDIFFYELTDAATGECTLVEQPELGKTYAMVVQNITSSYAGFYAIYSGLAKDKNNRGDVIKLDVTELPATLTITEELSSSNGAITPAKALWTLTDTTEEPEPEPIFVEGTPITAIEEFTDGATVYLQDAKFSKYIVNATTVADAADVNCYITLEQVADNTFRLKLSNGKYLSYDPATVANDAPAYEEEDQVKATAYTIVAQGTYWRFQFAFAEDATAEQTYNIVGGSAPIITWNKPDGAIRRNFTVYKVPSEEPQSDEEMFAELTATLAAAGEILTLNKVEGGLDEQNDYVISSTVAGVVGYKPFEDVFNIGEACAITQYIIELAANDATTLALICATQDITIQDLTVELQALIDAYNEAEVVLPEEGKTYIIRLAPNESSWALTLGEAEEGAKSLNTVAYSEISGSLSKDNAWTCMGQEEYVVESESLGMRLRFTSASHPELYLGWKTVTASSTDLNTYWQISGKNAAAYGYLTMQAYNGTSHYKYLTTNAISGALDHSDTPFWVENSEYSSSYIFDEVDPANLDEGTVGIGTVIRSNASCQRYNLQGQRIGQSQRGINLAGGKKLLVK